MDKTGHAQNLGKVIANLHGLEYVLRAFLHKYYQGEPETDADSLRVGARVPENWFTNFEPLEGLVKTFNRVSGNQHSVDPDIVNLRNMLAHGRVAGRTPSVFPMELVKFGKPQDKQVPVEAVVLMDDSWFESQIKFVLAQIEKVVAISRARGWNIM